MNTCLFAPFWMIFQSASVLNLFQFIIAYLCATAFFKWYIKSICCVLCLCKLRYWIKYVSRVASIKIRLVGTFRHWFLRDASEVKDWMRKKCDIRIYKLSLTQHCFVYIIKQSGNVGILSRTVIGNTQRVTPDACRTTLK